MLIDFVVTNRVSFLTLLPIYLSSEWSSVLLERAAGMFVACEVCMHNFSSLLSFLWSVCIAIFVRRDWAEGENRRHK